MLLPPTSSRETSHHVAPILRSPPGHVAAGLHRVVSSLVFVCMSHVKLCQACRLAVCVVRAQQSEMLGDARMGSDTYHKCPPPSLAVPI